MKKLILITVFILNSGFSYSIQGWVELPEISPNTLNSIYFIDENTGFACGNYGSIFKTTDGALSWLPQNSPDTRDFQNIYFLDNNRGLLTTVPQGSEAGYWFIVYYTTNQGASWTQIQQFNNFISDYYNDGNQFYFSFDGFFGFETTGGITYSGVNVINFNSIPYFDFFRNSSIKSVCKSNGKIWATTYFGDDVGTDVNSLAYTSDMGQSWNTVMHDSGVVWNPEPDHNKFYKIRFLNENTGYLSSKLGLMKTSNSGNNWYLIDTTFSKNVQKQFFTTADTGWIFNANKIYKTTDGGANFDLQLTHTSYIGQPFFLNSLTGYILCGNRILKTVTGGLTGIQNVNNFSIPEKFSLSQNYPNPFNPSTNLEFGISELGFVSLKVYDVLGNEVATLVNETKPAGNYNYQFSTVNYQLSSGIYFYSLSVDGDFD
jgi:photosystem II stability/assembly factor-like uncharacterized protein